MYKAYKAYIQLLCMQEVSESRIVDTRFWAFRSICLSGTQSAPWRRKPRMQRNSPFRQSPFSGQGLQLSAQDPENMREYHKMKNRLTCKYSSSRYMNMHHPSYKKDSVHTHTVSICQHVVMPTFSIETESYQLPSKQ